MNGYELLDPAFSGRLCLTLLHSIWQAAVVVLLVWGLDRFSRQRSAARNYSASVLAMFAVLAAMPATYLMVEVPAVEITQPSIEIASEDPVQETVIDTAQVAIPSLPTEFIPEAAPPAASMPVPEFDVPAMPVEVAVIPAPAMSIHQPEPSQWIRFAPWIACFYVIGVAWMLVRLLLSIYFANRLGKQAKILTSGPLFDALQSLASSWSMKVAPTLAVIPKLVMPKVIGILRPTILLPASAITGLSAEDLQMILAHELAHVRRYDMWINLIQRLAEAVLFFNPAIWYLSRRISTQREYCCDEIACQSAPRQAGGTQVRYAMALLRIVELMQDSSKKEQLSALAASGRSPSELRRRVARLFGEPLREPVRFSRSMILTITAASLLLFCGPTFWPSWANKPEQTNVATNLSELKPFSFGGKIENLLIGTVESIPQQWWDSQGVPQPDAQVEARGFARVTGENPESRKLIFQISKLPEDAHVKWKASSGSGGYGGTSSMAKINGIERKSFLSAYMLSKSDVGLRVGVASGPWRLKSSFHADGHVQDSGKTAVVVSQAFNKGDDVILVVADSLEVDQRIIAFSQNGEEHLGSLVGQRTGGILHQATWQIKDLQVDDIDHIELQTRKYEWVDIKLPNHPQRDWKAAILNLRTSTEKKRQNKDLEKLREMGVEYTSTIDALSENGLSLWHVEDKHWPAISQMTWLKSLVIIGSDLQGQQFHNIEKLINLQSLIIINSDFTPLEVKQIAGLGQLEHLDLMFSTHKMSDSWRIEKLGEMTPEEQKAHESILSSGLDDNQRIADASILTDRSLKHLRGMKNLKTLKLIRTHVTEVGIRHLGSLTELETLYVKAISYSDDSAKSFLQMPQLRKLQILGTVSDNFIHSLTPLKNLEEIHLSSEQITYKGTKHLAQFPKLRRVLMRGNQLTDQGVEELSKIQNLEYLDVSHGTGLITDSAIDKFRSQHPNCRIVRGKQTTSIKKQSTKQLSSGGKVEVLSIGSYDEKPARWWDAQGKLQTDVPYRIQGATVAVGENQVWRQLLFRIHDLPADSTVKWKLSNTGSSADGEVVLNGKESPPGYYSKVFATWKNTFDLGLSIGSGKWKTITKGNVNGSQSLGFANGTGIVFSGAFTKPDAAPSIKMDNVVIIVSHNFLKIDARVIAIDKQGKQHTSSKHSHFEAAGTVNQSQWYFRNLELNEIDHFEFQTREMEWIEIKDLPVHPQANLEISQSQPDEIEPEGTATISGRIVLEDGSPGTVEAMLRYSSHRKTGPHSTNSSSGNAGHFTDRFSFEVPSGSVWLKFDTREHAPAWAGPFELKPGEKLDDVKIVLRPGFSELLKVVNEQGEPIPNATFDARPEINGSTDGFSHPKKTDAQGEYMLKHLAETRYQLKITAPGYQPLSTKPLEVKEGEVLELTMIRSEPTTGVVLNADGTPAVNARLLLCHIQGVGRRYGEGEYSSWGQVMSTTDSQGQFKIDQLTAGLRYVFVVQGADQARAFFHDLQAGQEQVKIVLPERRDLRVKVTGDLSKLPIHNGKYHVNVHQLIPYEKIRGIAFGSSVGRGVLVEPTQEGGTALFRGLTVDLKPGTKQQQVLVSLGKETKTVELNLTGDTVVEFQLPDKEDLEGTATISGRIVLEDGSPATTKGRMYHSLRYAKGSVIGLGEQYTDRFSYQTRAGKIWLKYDHEDYAPVGVGPLDVKAGEVIDDVMIVLKPGFSELVRVLNEQGEPVAGATLVTHPDIKGFGGGPNIEKKIDAMGEYLLEHLAETQYVLNLTAPGYQPLRTKPLDVKEGEVLRLTMIRSEPTTGVVLNADGSPAVGARLGVRIEITPNGQNLFAGNEIIRKIVATTDDQGKFKMEQLTTGSHYLFIIESADGARAVVHDLQVGQKDFKIVLPKRRDLVVKITGDLSKLPTRSGMQYVSVRQRVLFEPEPDKRRGDLIGQDAYVVPTKTGGTATYRGLAIDLKPGVKNQKVEVMLGYDQKTKKTVDVNLTGDTVVEFQLPGEPVVMDVKPGKETSETDAKVAEQRFFRLNVVGPDGKPVANASVELRSNPATTAKQIRVGKYVRASTYGPFVTTDEKGQLEFELTEAPTRFNLNIKKPGFGPYWVSWSSAGHPQPIPSEFTAKLDQGWSVGGIVVDHNGNPVEGAQVSPSINYKKRPGDNRPLGDGSHVKTDAKGQWRYDYVPDSKEAVTVEISHSSYRPLIRLLSRKAFEVKLDAEPTELIELDPGVTVTGRVTDEAGQPVTDALVRTKFFNTVRETKTDKQGKYLLRGCEPKLSQIVVSAKGKAVDMQEVLIDSKMPPVNFVMKSGGKIRIRVVDENGKGLPKARIFFQRWRNGQPYFLFAHVNQYADENGVWEWDEAPLDQFEADICRPGGMQLSDQPLIAGQNGYKKYTFSPPKALVITGRVVDAKTKKVIQKFRVVPGVRIKGSKDGTYWQPTEGYEVTDGKYRFRQADGRLGYWIRIEAPGYQVAVSREIKPNEEELKLDFSLEPAEDIAAIILTPNGKPASQAKIAIGGAGTQINIRNGEFRRQRTATSLEASDDGRFSFPEPTGPFQVVILHSTGFAKVSSKEGKIPNLIRLTPWAQAEGTFRVGDQLAANAYLEIHTAFHSHSDDLPYISTQTIATTNEEGIFHFERVFPGKGSIGRRFTIMVNDGPSEVISSKRIPVEFVAGKSTKLDLGGVGRPIVGKLVLPGSTRNQQLTFWKQAYLNIQSDLGKRIAVPPLPRPPEDAKTSEQINAWYEQWIKTEAGKTWQTASLAQQELSQSIPVYIVSLDRDGSFRIENVPEGDYIINGAGISDYRFSIPPIKNGYQAEPFDLGNLINKVFQQILEMDEKKPAGTETSSNSSPPKEQKTTSTDQPNSRTVSGMIAGPGGKPVAGAMVWLAVKEREPDDYVGGAIVGQAKSTGDGNFNIALPRSKIDLLVDSGRRLNLWVWKPGLLLTMQAIDKTLPTGPVKILLQPDPSVEVLIRNADGTPCLDATVAHLWRIQVRKNEFVSLDCIPEPIRKQIAVRCDARGKVRIVGLDQHQQTVMLETESPSSGQQIFLSSNLLLKLPKELQLRKTGAISGRLNAPKGSQANFSKVVLRVTTSGEDKGIRWVALSTVRPDRQGHFSLPAIAAGLIASVQVQIDESDHLELQASPSLEGVVVKPNETTKLEIPMLKTVKITQIVRDGKTKEPLPYLHVQLQNNHQKFSTITDKNGSFTARVLPGEKYPTYYNLPGNYVGSSGILQNTTTSDVVLEPAEFFANRTIEGTVLDSSGQPFAGVKVGANWDIANEKVRKAKGSNSTLVLRSATTDNDGRFLLEGIDSGAKITITPLRAQVILGDSIQIEPVNDKPVLLKTRVFDFTSINGRVNDSNGKPVAGAEFHVQLLNEKGGGTAHRGFTDANGRIKTPVHFPKQYNYGIVIYSKQRLPDAVAFAEWSHPDEVNLVVDPKKLKLREVPPIPAEKPNAEKGSKEQKTISTAQPNSRAVSGMIAGADGKPVAGAMVWLAVKERDTDNYDGGAIVGQAKSTGDGKFKIALPRSKIKTLVDNGENFNLWGWKPGLVLTMHAIEKSLPAEPVKIQLQADSPVEVLIRNADGTLCTDATVSPVMRKHYGNAQGLSEYIPKSIRKQIANRSDAQGRVQITEHDREHVSAWEVKKEGVSRQLFFSLRVGQIPRSLQLPETGAISGRLMSPEGSQADLSKVKLRITTSKPQKNKDGVRWIGDSTVQPDRQGRFTVPVIARGNVGVLVINPDDFELQAIPSLEGVVVKPNETTKFEIPMLKTVKATQLVIDAKTQEPLQNILVQLRGGHLTISARTNDKGRFTVRVIPGKKYQTTYKVPNNYINESYRAFRNPTTSDLELEPAEFFQRQTLEGVVLDSSGRPFVGIKVKANWEDPAGKASGYGVQVHPNLRPWASTGANGKFLIGGIHPGAKITLTAERTGIVLSKAVQVEPGDSRPVTLKTDRFEFTVIKGRVIDTNHKPVAGAKFVVYLVNGKDEAYLYRGYTDANGRTKTPAHFPKRYEYRINIISKQGHAITSSQWSHPDEISMVVNPKKLYLRKVPPLPAEGAN